MWDYSDAYIVAKGRITITGTNNVNTRNKMLIFDLNHAYQKPIKNSVTIQKILIIVMLMYNLLEYSDNYSVSSGRSWIYRRDEVNGDAIENENN